MRAKKKILRVLPVVAALVMIGIYIVQQSLGSGIYRSRGHLAKVQDSLNEMMVDNASEHFQKIYTDYLTENGTTPYLAVIPDKNYYLKSQKGMTKEEYDTLFTRMLQENSNMQFLDLRDYLELSDYYRTDPHWKQECIVDVAEFIGESMGAEVHAAYERKTLDMPFEGTYAQKYPWSVKADQIQYLTNDSLTQSIVTVYGGKAPVITSVYNLDKAKGNNPYDMFLDGASAVITIENPLHTTDRELVIFRDSFGSSLAPLLVPGYSKVTLVDIRYIQSDYVGEFVTFQNQDVLFLYSAQLLNHSKALK